MYGFTSSSSAFLFYFHNEFMNWQRRGNYSSVQFCSNNIHIVAVLWTCIMHRSLLNKTSERSCWLPLVNNVCLPAMWMTLYNNLVCCQVHTFVKYVNMMCQFMVLNLKLSPQSDEMYALRYCNKSAVLLSTKQNTISWGILLEALNCSVKYCTSPMDKQSCANERTHML